MIGNLYSFVVDNIVGQVPLEFQFIIPIVVILICFLIIYVIFSGFIILNDIIGK